MTVRAIYVDGVFRPQGPVALEERTEVEIEIKATAPSLEADEVDPRSFVGFIKNAPKGVPLAQDHDEHLDK
jgi:predicted DNA-binding antitoxin AbrB/MazE fold protein